MTATRVPIEPIRQAMNEYLERYEAGVLNNGDFIAPIQALALSAGVEVDQLYRVRTRQTMRTIDFDQADRLLCAMHLVYLWWEEPLKDVYLALDLADPGAQPGLTPDGLHRCASPGCSVLFEPQKYRRDKKYCSNTCRNRVLNRAANGYQPRQSKCRNGHWRTDDNTIIEQDGTRRCKVCRGEEKRRSYKRVHPGARAYGPYEGRSVGTYAEAV